MAYEPELETGENIRCRVGVNISNSAQPFHLVVSDRAVYWPQTKFLPGTDPFYFRRITHDQIKEVTIRRLSPYGFWILGALMIALGLFFFASLREHGKIVAPFAATAGGLIFLFSAKGRYGLNVVTSEKTFRWEPPPAPDRASKEKIASALNDVSEASRVSGLRVNDQRKTMKAL
jgi:hypothetical protein